MTRADSASEEDDFAGPAQLGVPPGPVPFTGWSQEWQVTYTAFHADVYKKYLTVAYLQLGSDADAEEAVDATFDVLADKWGQMLRMDSLRGYAWTVLKRRILDQVRRRTRRGNWMEMAAFQTANVGPDDPFDLLTMRMAAFEEIRRLPERQRDVVALCHCLDYTTEEAADLMGVEAATVRSHLSQARRRLAARLGEDADDDTTNPGEKK
ncbi:RNA polymerase sigma factor [Kitasatospora sp. NPDC006697]|uniref:RNA polymerase sigma factor n=1 Tax=Kitasatospora sp. NPDC006697 TaxID=3364020 RepID=UPI00367AEA6E